MKTPEGISLIPTGYQEIISLLTSEELAAVECPIADQCRLKIHSRSCIDDHEPPASRS